MGTYLKGNSKYYRSIGQNVLLASSKYHYENGRFGVNSPSTGNKTRNIASSDPQAIKQEILHLPILYQQQKIFTIKLLLAEKRPCTKVDNCV